MLVIMTVYVDAVKLETEECGRRTIIGWFLDEVSAIGAAVERCLMLSAILAERRKLPELVICTEYKEEFCRRTLIQFRRATRVKWASDGKRKVIMRPGSWGKTWIATHQA